MAYTTELDLLRNVTAGDLNTDKLNVNISSGSVTISGTVAATQSGTWNIGTLTTITNPVTVAQSTAANLNATVVGTGTFAVQATQSGTWTISTKTALSAASPTAATVGVSSAQAVASNPSRTGLVLINTSSNKISLGFGATAVLNSGITLLPGGTFVMDEFTFSTAAVNAIAGGASSNLSIQEYS